MSESFYKNKTKQYWVKDNTQNLSHNKSLWYR